jgi:hypothetical protein
MLEPRAVPRALWVLWAGFFGILLGYSVLVPLIRSPDERLHVDLILSIEGGRYGWDPYGGRMTERGEAANAALGSWVQPKTADNATPRRERPSLDELGGLGPSDRANWQRQHPPLYYVVLGNIVDGVADRVDQHVWLLRLINAVLASLLIPLGFLAAAAATERTAVRVAAAASLAAIPQLAHIGASVSNDNLLNVLAAATLVAALHLTRHAVTTRRLVLLGGLLGLALLTKNVAGVLTASVVLAVTRRDRRDGRSWLDVAGHLAVVLGLAFVVGGWWWARNLVIHGTLLPSDYEPALEPGASRPPTWTWLQAFVDRVDRSFWGELGSLEAEIPWWAAWAATALLVVVIAAALRTRRAAHLPLAVALVPLAAALLLLLALTWRGVAVDGRFPGLQGRYLYVGVIGVVVAVAALLDGLSGETRRRAGWVLAGAVVGLHAVTVHTALQWFYGGPALGLGDQLRGLLAWSPVGNVATVLILIAGATGVIACAAVAQRAASSECQRQADPMISSRPLDGSQPSVLRTSELSE